MAWTDEQKKAIDLEGKNIIVSAGAGSGKTAVLTARVERKLLSGVHINELLILTFTNAAAREMKERIRKTIKNSSSIKDEANLLDSAYITTFDSFSLSLVKKYHTRVNVSNNISISDEVVIDIEKNRILDEIFDKYYLSPKKSFSKLIHDFSLKDDLELKKYLLNIYRKVELRFNKEDYLEELFENVGDLDSYVSEYLELIIEKQRDIKSLILELNNYFEDSFVLKVKDNFKKLLEASTYCEFLDSLDYKKMVVPRGSSDEGKSIKSAIFDLAKEISELCIYTDEDEMKEEILSTNSNRLVIIEILKEFDKKLELIKRERSIYNFNDISRMAIKIVRDNPDIREELRSSFNEILVDEYQDTSDIQEMFISLISNNNVYMVGDIKQSIYRFRNANPYIFKNKYDTYRDTDQGEKIDLVKNFRSREEVLHNINLLFDLFMDDKIGGADYKVSHRMVFGNNTYNEEGKTLQNNDLDVIVYDKDKLGNITKEEEEAFIIGNDIKDKINNNYQIFDKDNKLLRNAEYKDFVILLDRSRDFLLYKKVFEYLNIPLSILKDESLKKDQDIIVIRNLLRLLICIKEERFDLEFKYCFTSISRSFLFRISDEEIYNYLIDNNYFDSSLYKKCLEVIPYIDIMPISCFIDYVLDTFNYQDKLFTIGRIKTFRVRREYIYNLCRSYEELGNDIYQFIDYLNQIFNNDYDLKFNINEDSSNSVKIMTIHKSKGLEYPICYFAGFSSRFNISDLKEKIVYDNKYGIVLPKVDGYYKDTILKTIIKANYRREEISERIRLLYVAMTRAKEKMIIVMPKGEEVREVTDIVPLYERDKYNSFLSIMNSIYTVLLPYISESQVIGSVRYKSVKSLEKNINKTNDLLEVIPVEVESSEVDINHYSKSNLHLIDEEEVEKLEFGTMVHKILEEIDFNNYDLDLYDIDLSIKEKINMFINSSLIKDKLKFPMYKEYEFMYKEDNSISHGIIDLLIEKDNTLYVIDYKLKNIEDIEYNKQLNGYRNYLKSISNKDIKCYLYSIIDGEYREVLDE